MRVDAGAIWDISGGGSGFVNDGTVIVDGALVFSAVTHDTGAQARIEVGNGGVADFAGPVGKGEAVVFTDDTGTVLLDRLGRFHGVFSIFRAGDTIDLVGKAADGFSFSNHHLIVTEQGATVADLMFIALPIHPPKFALSLDGNGGTDITFVAPAAEFWTIKG